MLFIISLLILMSPQAQAQVIYGDTPEQKKTGVYKTVIVKTDAFSSDIVITTAEEDKDIKIKSCVQIDDGECVESEYFKATIKDITKR